MDEGERGIYGRGGFDPVGARELRAQEIENILDRLLENRGIETGVAAPVTGVDQETVVQTIQDMLSAGTLTAEEIQRRIDAGDITKDDVLSIIQSGFELSEGQLAQLFEAGMPCGAESNMAKMLAADAAWEAGDTCVQTFGGFAFAGEYDVERKYREARLYRVAPISTNLVLAYLAEHVLGLPRSY